MKICAAALIAHCVAIPVTFKVGFGGHPISAEGPHLAGSFQAWSPSATALSDENMDGIYEVTMDLPPASYQFKFINGNTWEQAETVPSSCSETESGNANRAFVVEEAAVFSEVNVCFQECQPCTGLSACKMFNCPAGSILKANFLNGPGQSSATCCEPVVTGKGAIVVRSSGFSDGNWAEFWLNGQLLYGTGTRGLTIVEVEPSTAVKSVNTFDTYVVAWLELNEQKPTVGKSLLLEVKARISLLVCLSAEIRVVALYAGLIAFSLSFDFAGRIAALSGITDGKELHFSLLCYSIVGDRLAEAPPETEYGVLDSTQLETFLSSVVAGNLILAAAVDEASANLSPQAKELIASCGALKINQLAFRSSYALIGTKDGSAMSEVVLQEGGGTAVAIAQMTLPEPVLPLCKMYNCPSGYILMASSMETPGCSLDACCQEATASKGAVVVRSAGFSDGNWAEFWLNGDLLYATGTRGLTILDMWPNTTDPWTWKIGVRMIATPGFKFSTARFMLAEVEIVLLTDACLLGQQRLLIHWQLLSNCGATLIPQLMFRSSYALIGINGANALSEVVLPEGAGHAVAVAEVDLPEQGTTTPMPPTSFCAPSLASWYAATPFQD
ncbi:Cemip [Symbiodinium pilosum]|uniref:Cemip protein n=1 Tax=Symbiodinium pilosum TaxID=2952 RepID=A0A812PP17_SYMPI|nr:Cemip [Symbiodinium pilosum]